MARRSELEGAVLGLVWKDGPLTAYAVRAHFQSSRSSHFSGSAGAIYPLMDRLTEAGLLIAEERSQGRRASKQYRVTAVGKRALRAWLSPVDGWMAAVEFDPIRTRVHFLALLSPKERVSFLATAAARLTEEIAATESLMNALEESQDEWEAKAALGALRVLRARLDWIGSLGPGV